MVVGFSEIRHRGGIRGDSDRESPRARVRACTTPSSQREKPDPIPHTADIRVYKASLVLWDTTEAFAVREEFVEVCGCGGGIVKSIGWWLLGWKCGYPPNPNSLSGPRVDPNPTNRGGNQLLAQVVVSMGFQ